MFGGKAYQETIEKSNESVCSAKLHIVSHFYQNKKPRCYSGQIENVNLFSIFALFYFV